MRKTHWVGLCQYLNGSQKEALVLASLAFFINVVETVGASTRILATLRNGDQAFASRAIDDQLELLDVESARGEPEGIIRICTRCWVFGARSALSVVPKTLC